MAAIPIHAAVAVPAEYSLAFAAPAGTHRTQATVNASDMKVEVENSHWFVLVASHELAVSGLRYVVSYAQLNELMWSVAECVADLRSVRFVQVAVELAWIQDLLQACLNAGLPRSPLRTWSAVCAVLGRCAQSLDGAAAATRRLSAGDLRKLQTPGGGRGAHEVHLQEAQEVIKSFFDFMNTLLSFFAMPSRTRSSCIVSSSARRRMSSVSMTT
ncbi:hypothetical protein AB1Y20_006130 [Prymnesium parvum]|uniref:Spindle pole body component n=1 Tax=Prymnesium parvum TaxID=97485 RepID=A0AB34J3Y7_PRYPA